MKRRNPWKWSTTMFDLDELKAWEEALKRLEAAKAQKKQTKRQMGTA